MSMNWKQYNQEVLEPMAKQLREWMWDEEKREAVINHYDLMMSELKQLKELRKQKQSSLAKLEAKKSKEIGVCERCDGTGRFEHYASWSDSIHPHIHSCKQCSPADRERWSEQLESVGSRLRKDLRKLEEEICELEKYDRLPTPKRGDVVVLVANPRAKKAELKIDHVGFIFWDGPGNYGQRYGVNDTEDFTQKTDNPLWITGEKYLYTIDEFIFSKIKEEVSRIDKRRAEEEVAVKDYAEQLELALYM